MKNTTSNSFQITTTLKLNIGNDFQKSLIQNKHLQGAIKKCLSYEMTMLFGIFYSPNDIIMKVFKNGSIEIIYKSNLFIFQPFQEWFVKKEHDLKQIWNTWNGQMKFSDLYFIGRYYDDSLKTLLGLNLDLKIDIQEISDGIQKQSNIQKQANIRKQIILKQKQVSFYQEAQQQTSLISPNFELQTFVVQKKTPSQQKSLSSQKRQSKFNIYLLTEQNDLWMDDLIRIDVQYQLPMNKLVYQSFNLLHFLEHCLLAFKQEVQEKYNIKYTNGSTAQSGCMMISIVLSVSHLKEFVEMFVNRQRRMYSKLEADRIVQEMYQVGEYKDCLREIAFLHNSDFQKQENGQKQYNQNQQYNWNNILYDLYTQLEIVQVFVQISSHISYKTEKETENILKYIKQMIKIPSPRDTYIKKYFESFGSFNQLPLFMYKTLIKIKTSILKMENIKVVPFVYAQDSENIYLLKEHFDYLDKIIEKGLNMEVYDVFNPFNRFFAFEELQQCWIQYNKETIDRIQYQGSLKTNPIEKKE